MSKGFNLTAEINLRGPSNIRTVVADIRRQIGSVSADITPVVTRQSVRNVASVIRSQLSNIMCDVKIKANTSSLRSIGSDIRRQLSGVSANINVRANQSSIRTMAADIRRQLGSINANVNVRFNTTAVTTYSNNLRGLNANLNQIITSATNATGAINALAAAMRSASAAGSAINNTAINVGNVSRAANNTRNSITLASNEMVEFGRQSGLAFRRFSAITTVTSVIYGLTNAVSQGVKSFIDFDLQMTRISQVTGDSKDKLAAVANTITDLSTKLGVSSNELTTTTVTLAQAGLTAKDTATALKALALSALAPSFDDMNQTVEGSIALMRQFGIGANQLEMALGSVNAVSAKFAVEASDIITAIQRTGGVFAAASRGVSTGTEALNEFIAVFTSIRATTRESAETIATGLRTIFTRIQRAGTIEALQEFGVTLTDLEGKFVGPYIAVQRLSEGLSRLDPRDLKFSQIVEELGGFRQIGKVLPLIQQFATAQDALKVAQQGQGSLATDAAKGQLALAIQIQKVREEFLALIRSIGDTSSFQNIVKVGLDLASALIKVADATKGVLPLLTLFAAFKGITAATQYIGGFSQGIRGNGGGARRANEGGRIYAFASGGLVPGYGNGDTVSAKLTPGEFVMSKPAAQSIGVGNLHSLNRSRGGSIFPKNYYQGGVAALKSLSPGESGNRISDYIDYYENETSKTSKQKTGRKNKLNRQSPKMLRGFQLKDNVNSDIEREVIGAPQIKTALANNANFRSYINSRAAKDKSREFYAGQGVAFEEFLFQYILGEKGYKKAPSKTYPLDFIPPSSELPPVEAKFTHEQVPDAFILNKRLRYNLLRRKNERISPLTRREKPDDIQLGPTIVYEMEAGLKDKIFTPNSSESQKRGREERAQKSLLKIDKLGLERNNGGLIQRFPIGGKVSDQTFYHGSGRNLEELDVTKSPGGVIGAGAYLGLNKTGLAADYARKGMKHSGGSGGIYPVKIKGGISDFPEATAQLSPKVLQGIQNIFKTEKIPTSGINLRTASFSTALDHIIGHLAERIEPKLRKQKDIKDPGFEAIKIASQKARELMVANGIAGAKKIADRPLDGQMAAVYDPTRIVEVGKPIRPGKKYTGGEVQKFMAGEMVRRTKKERFKKITESDAAKLTASQIITGLTTGQTAPVRVEGMDVGMMRTILGKRNTTPDIQRKKDEILKAYTRRINGEVDQRLGITNQKQAAGLLFGIAGLYGSPFKPTDMVVGDKGELKNITTVQVMGGVPRKKLMDKAGIGIDDLDAYGKDFRKSVKKGAKRLLVSDILSQLGLGKALYADFDKTLVFGADNLPDLQSFNNKRQVGRQLLSEKARLSTLGQKLRDLLLVKPQLSPYVNVLTARPPSTVGLLQAFLKRQNLNIPRSQFTGVGGNNLNEAAIAKLKAAELPPGSVFVDDNGKNTKEAELKSKSLKAKGEAGIKVFRYKSARNPLDQPGEDTAAGLAFQESLRGLLSDKRAMAAFAETGGKSIDFPLGLGKRAALFGLKPNIPTDAKRTLNGPSTAKDNITNYLKVRGYNSGGIIQKFETGGATDSLRQYQLRSKDLHSAVISNKPDKTKSNQIKDIDSSMMDSLPKILYSGFKENRRKIIDQDIDPNKDYKSQLMNKTFSFPSFLSTSINYDSAKRFAGSNGGVLHIRPTGKGANVLERTGNKGKSALYDMEAEYLLPRNSRFKINRVLDTTGPLGWRSDWGAPNFLEAEVQSFKNGGNIRRFADAGLVAAPKLIQRGGFKYSLEDIIKAGFTEAQFMKQIPAPGGYGEQWQIGGYGEGSIPMPPSLQPYKAPPSVVQDRVDLARSNAQNRMADAVMRDGRTLRDYEVSSDQKAFKKMRGYAIGGSIQDTVPALVSNGEAFVPPETAKNIGYDKLREMNQADRNGMRSFSGGGISLFKGPGSGTSDSIGPVGLPVGGFVIRAAATKALGLNKGGTVQRFAFGGSPRAVPNISGMSDARALSVVGVTDNVTGQLENLATVLQELGVRSGDSARIIQSGIQATYQQAIRATEADIRRARLAGASAEQISQAENQLADIRRQAQQDIQTRRTLGGLSGNQLQQIESDAERQRNRITRTRTNQLRTQGLSQEDIQTQLQTESGDINRIAYGRATRRQGINLGAAGLNGDDAQRFIRQSMGDPRVLKQMDAQYVIERRRSIAAEVRATGDRQRANSIRAGLDNETNRAINDEIKARKDVVNTLGRQRGQQVPGGDQRGNFGGMLGLSFGLQGIGSLLAQQINASASSSNASTAGAIQGGVTGLATGGMLVGGLQDMLGSRLSPAVSKLLGGFGLLATLAASVGQAFIEARNAAIEFEKNFQQKKLETAISDSQQLFEKLNTNIKNVDIQRSLASKLAEAGEAAKAGIEANNKLAKAFWVNLFDAFGSADQGAASQRSEILDKKGIMAYFRSTDFFGGGDKGRSKEYQSLIPEKARENSKSFAETSKLTTDLIGAKIQSGSSIEDIFKDPAWKKQAEVIARANAAVEEEILSINNNANISNLEKEARINNIIAINAEHAVRQQASVIERQQQLKSLDNTTNVYTRSLERMFQNMEQSIGRASFSLEQMSKDIDLASDSFQGQAKVGSVALTAINALQNPRAYSQETVSNSRNVAAESFGIRSPEMVSLLGVGEKIEATVMSTINKSVNKNPGITEEALGSIVGRDVKEALANLSLPSDLVEKLSGEVGNVLKDFKKSGDEKLDYTQLSEKLGQLNKVVDSSRRAQEVAIKALEHYQNALNVYTQNINKTIDLQISANQRLRKATDIVADSELSLAKTLGKNISLENARTMVNSKVAAKTGGVTNPNDIFDSINKLENTRVVQQAEQRSAGERGVSGQADFIKFTKNLADTNVGLRENIDALKYLADNTDIAASAMEKIQEAQQKTSGKVSFIEKLVTSTPEELNGLSSAFQRLQNNANGQINTINRSTGAQRAYYEALQNGASMMEAMKAAQSAFVNERKETLGALNDILPFLGNGQQAGNIKANVLESMLQESGMGVSPVFQQILNTLRNPELDPATQAAIAEYREGNNLQARANSLLAQLDSNLARDIANQSAKALASAISQVKINFETKEITDIANHVQSIDNKMPGAGGVAPVGKASGGIIYASAGQAIDFKSQGTDTIPAMLTPGEFVVNRAATQSNLPLLQAINSNKYSSGGAVRYYSAGGYVSRNFKAEYKDKTSEDMAQAPGEYVDPKQDFNSKIFTAYPGPTTFVRGVGNTEITAPIINNEKRAASLNSIKADDLYLGSAPIIRTTSNNTVFSYVSPLPINNYPLDPIGDIIAGNIKTKKVAYSEWEKYRDDLMAISVTDNILSDINVGALEDIPPAKISDKIFNPNVRAANNIGIILSNKSKQTKYLKPDINSIDSPRVAKIFDTHPNNEGAISYGLRVGLQALSDIGTLGMGGTLDTGIPGIVSDKNSINNSTKNTLGVDNLFISKNTVVDSVNNSNLLKASVPGRPKWNTNKADIESLMNDSNKYLEAFKLSEKFIKNKPNRSDFGHEPKELRDLRENLFKLYNGANSVDIPKEQLEFFNMSELNKSKDTISSLTGLNRNYRQSIKKTINNPNVADEFKKKYSNLVIGGVFPDQLKEDKYSWTQNRNLNIVSDKGDDELFPWIAGATPEQIITSFKAEETNRIEDLKKRYNITERQYSKPDKFTLALPNPIGNIDLPYDMHYTEYSAPKVASKPADADEYGFNKSKQPFDKIKLITPIQSPSDPFAQLYKNKTIFTAFRWNKELSSNEIFNPTNIDLANNNVFKDLISQNNSIDAQNNLKDQLNKINYRINLDSLVDTTLPAFSNIKLFKDNPIDKKDYMFPIGEYLVNAAEKTINDRVNKSKNAAENIDDKGQMVADTIKENDLPSAVKNLAKLSLGVFGNKRVPGLPGNWLYNSLRGVLQKPFRDSGVAQQAAGYTSNVFGNFGGYLSRLAPMTRNANIYQQLKELFTLGSGAAMAFAGLASGDTRMIGQFTKLNLNAEDLFRSLGGAALFGRISSAPLSGDYKAILGQQLDGAKIKTVGANGTLSPVSPDKAIPEKYNDLVNIAFNPYNEFPSKDTRKGIIEKLTMDMINAKDQVGMQYFDSNTQRFLYGNMTSLYNWYGGNGAWEGQDYFFDKNVDPDNAKRTQQVIDSLRGQDGQDAYTKGNIAHNTLGFASRYGSLPTDKWFVQRREAGLNAEAQPDKNNEALRFATGGVVYAQNGQMINFQPRGTDTVPAMLTPGEFVINRSATQQHLPLLKAINSGNSIKGLSKGGVAYLADGGTATVSDDEQFNRNAAMAIKQRTDRQKKQREDLLAAGIDIQDPDYKDIDFEKLRRSGMSTERITEVYKSVKVRKHESEIAKLESDLNNTKSKQKSGFLGFGKVDKSKEITEIQAQLIEQKEKLETFKKIKTNTDIVENKTQQQAVNETRTRLKAIISQEQSTIKSLEKSKQESGVFDTLKRGITGVDDYALEIKQSQQKISSAKFGLDSLSDATNSREGKIINGLSPASSFNNSDYYDNGQQALNTARGLAGLPHIDAKTHKPKNNEPVVNRGLYNSGIDDSSEKSSTKTVTSGKHILGINTTRMGIGFDRQYTTQNSFHKARESSIDATRDITIDALTSLIGLGAGSAGLQFGKTALKTVVKKAAGQGAKYGGVSAYVSGRAKAQDDVQSGKITVGEGQRRTGIQTLTGIITGGLGGSLGALMGAGAQKLANKSAEKFINKIISGSKESKLNVKNLIKKGYSAYDAALMESDRLHNVLSDIQDQKIEQISSHIVGGAQRGLESAKNATGAGLRTAANATVKGAVAARKYAASVPTKLKGMFVRLPGFSRKNKPIPAVSPSLPAGNGLTRFKFTAIDATTGKEVRDIVDAATEAEAQATIRSMGYMVVTIKDLNAKSWIGKLLKPFGFQNGGMIYAENGMMIPYQPKGTDTVPAMLTPGEFVINRAATQQNLPLLHAINSGAKAYSSGGVVYAADGALIGSSNSSSNSDISKISAASSLVPQILSKVKDSDKIKPNLNTVNDNVILNHKQIQKLSSNVGGITNNISDLNTKIDLILYGLNNTQVRNMVSPGHISSGGVVYAANGTLVNYQPRGTDTIPAMLTPGEFVVNARATRSNLSLLQSINQSKGGSIKGFADGGVVYAAEGFDPSRPLNPMMNRHGKGPTSTLPQQPITNFDSEKLAEEGKAFIYGAAKSVLPGLAGLGAGLLGLPTTGPGGFAIGLGAGAAVYQAQENYLNALAPETNRQMKDTTEEHWQSSLLGSMVGGFGADKIGRKLLSPFMKNATRIPAILSNNNASVRPDMKSASQEAMEEFFLRSRPAASARLDVPKANKTLPFLRSLEEKGIIKTTQSSASKFNTNNRRDLYQIDQILYHGTGHVIDDIDPSKGGGILGGGFYTGFKGHEGIAARFAAMGKANQHVYPVRVSGGIGDFPEATETLGGNSKILSVIEKLFTEQNLSRQTRQFSGKWGKTGPIYNNTDLNLKDMTFKDVVDLLKNRYSETIRKNIEQENAISLSKISPQEIAIRADKLGEEKVRQLLVKSGIPGAKDTTGKLSGTGEPMVSIYDQSRLRKEGKPFVPNSLKPQIKANGGVVYAARGGKIPLTTTLKNNNIARSEILARQADAAKQWMITLIGADEFMQPFDKQGHIIPATGFGGLMDTARSNVALVNGTLDDAKKDASQFPWFDKNRHKVTRASTILRKMKLQTKQKNDEDVILDELAYQKLKAPKLFEQASFNTDLSTNSDAKAQATIDKISTNPIVPPNNVVPPNAQQNVQNLANQLSLGKAQQEFLKAENRKDYLIQVMENSSEAINSIKGKNKNLLVVGQSRNTFGNDNAVGILQDQFGWASAEKQGIIDVWKKVNAALPWTARLEKGPITQYSIDNAGAIPAKYISKGGIIYAAQGGKIDVKDKSQIDYQMSSLINSLLPYTSGKEGKEKLLALSRRNMDIDSITIGKPDYNDSLASYRTKDSSKTTNKKGKIKFAERLTGAATVRHEMAHAIANDKHDGLLAPFINASLIEELKGSEYKDHGNTSYKVEDLIKKPAEMFAVLASIGGSLGGSSKIFLKNSMRALGYNKGGVIYAQNGLDPSIPVKAKVTKKMEGLSSERLSNKYAQEYLNSEGSDSPEQWLRDNYPGLRGDKFDETVKQIKIGQWLGVGMLDVLKFGLEQPPLAANAKAQNKKAKRLALSGIPQKDRTEQQNNELAGLRAEAGFQDNAGKINQRAKDEATGQKLSKDRNVEQYTRQYIESGSNSPEGWLKNNYPGIKGEKFDATVEALYQKQEEIAKNKRNNAQFLLTDDTGKFYGKVVGVGTKDGKQIVSIEKIDIYTGEVGKTIEVPYERLSPESQKKVDDRTKYTKAITGEEITLTDNTGKHSRKASFESVDLDNNTVTIVRSEDGRKKVVPLNRLSKQDRDLALEFAKRQKAIKAGKELQEDSFGGTRLIKEDDGTVLTSSFGSEAESKFKPREFYSGGVVYADAGMLIPYQPRGTDTVPAMLTPGEFVINRAATQQHLPLLKAINSGQKFMNKGGVVYLEGGDVVPSKTKEEINIELATGKSSQEVLGLSGKTLHDENLEAANRAAEVRMKKGQLTAQDKQTFIDDYAKRQHEKAVRQANREIDDTRSGRKAATEASAAAYVASNMSGQPFDKNAALEAKSKAIEENANSSKYASVDQYRTEIKQKADAEEQERLRIREQMAQTRAQAEAKQTEKDRHDSLWINSNNLLTKTAGYVGGVGQATGELAYGAANVVGGLTTAAIGTALGQVIDDKTGQTTQNKRGATLDKQIIEQQKRLSQQGVLGESLAEAQKRVKDKGPTAAQAFRQVGVDAAHQGAYTAVELGQAVAGRGPIQSGDKTWLHQGDDKRVEMAGSLGTATRVAQNIGYVAATAAPALVGAGNPTAGASALTKTARAFSALDNAVMSPGTLLSGAGKVLGAADKAIAGGRVAKGLNAVGANRALSAGRSALDIVRGSSFADNMPNLHGGLKSVANSEAGKGVRGMIGAIGDVATTFNPLVPKTQRALMAKNLDAAYGALPENASKAQINLANRYGRLTGGDPTRASSVLRERAKKFGQGVTKRADDFALGRGPFSERIGVTAKGNPIYQDQMTARSMGVDRKTAASMNFEDKPMPSEWQKIIDKRRKKLLDRGTFESATLDNASDLLDMRFGKKSFDDILDPSRRKEAITGSRAFSDQAEAAVDINKSLDEKLSSLKTDVKDIYNPQYNALTKQGRAQNFDERLRLQIEASNLYRTKAIGLSKKSRAVSSRPQINSFEQDPLQFSRNIDEAINPNSFKTVAQESAALPTGKSPAFDQSLAEKLGLDYSKIGIPTKPVTATSIREQAVIQTIGNETLTTKDVASRIGRTSQQNMIPVSSEELKQIAQGRQVLGIADQQVFRNTRGELFVWDENLSKMIKIVEDNNSLHRKRMIGGFHSNGGMIYASSGTLIPYQPRGTDTVPAMLTPGEFVVNAKATSQNLSLLKSINNGAKAYSSGGIVYLKDGDEVVPKAPSPRWNTKGKEKPSKDEMDERNAEYKKRLKDKKENNPYQKMLTAKGEAATKTKDQQVKDNQEYSGGIFSKIYNEVKKQYDNDPKKFDISSYVTISPQELAENYEKDFSTQPPDKIYEYAKSKYNQDLRRNEYLKTIYSNSNNALLTISRQPAVGNKPIGNVSLRDVLKTVVQGSYQEGLALDQGWKILGQRHPEFLAQNAPGNKRGQKNTSGAAAGHSIGGLIYANNGMLIPYQPRGTDTVPAMLTPGEFVVNKQAAQNNLDLLQQINSKKYNQGGHVVYKEAGGPIQLKKPIYRANGGMTDETSGGGGGVSNNKDMGLNFDGLSQFTATFGKFIQQLNSLKLPEVINIQGNHKVDVVINGAGALQGMQEGIRNMIVGEVNKAMSSISKQTDGAIA